MIHPEDQLDIRASMNEHFGLDSLDASSPLLAIRDFAVDELPEFLDGAKAQPKVFQEKFLKRLGELHLLGLGISEAEGGRHLSEIDQVRAMAMLSYVSSGHALSYLVEETLTSFPISLAGHAEQKHILKNLLRGTKRASFALTEPDTGSDATNIHEVTATWSEDTHTYQVKGKKRFITNADGADYIVLATRTKEGAGKNGITVFLIDAAKAQQDGTMKVNHIFDKRGQYGAVLTEIEFTNLAVDAKDMLGEFNKGWSDVVEPTLRHSRIWIAAQALGLSARAYDEALHRVRQRVQFRGETLLQKSKIQMQLAKMRRLLNISDYLIVRAAYEQEARDPVAFTWASLAKLYAADAADWITDMNLEMHGGLGFTYDGSRAFELRVAALPIKIYEGTANVLQMIIEKHFTDRQLAYLAKHLRMPDRRWTDRIAQADAVIRKLETWKATKRDTSTLLADVRNWLAEATGMRSLTATKLSGHVLYERNPAGS